MHKARKSWMWQQVQSSKPYSKNIVKLCSLLSMNSWLMNLTIWMVRLNHKMENLINWSKSKKKMTRRKGKLTNNNRTGRRRSNRQLPSQPCRPILPTAWLVKQSKGSQVYLQSLAVRELLPLMQKKAKLRKTHQDRGAQYSKISLINIPSRLKSTRSLKEHILRKQALQVLPPTWLPVNTKQDSNQRSKLVTKPKEHKVIYLQVVASI